MDYAAYQEGQKGFLPHSTYLLKCSMKKPLFPSAELRKQLKIRNLLRQRQIYIRKNCRCIIALNVPTLKSCFDEPEILNYVLKVPFRYLFPDLNYRLKHDPIILSFSLIHSHFYRLVEVGK